MFSRMVPAEQPGVLEHHAEEPAQVVAGHVPGVHAVDGDGAGVDLVEAQEQVDQRGLAGPRRSDDGHRLAGADLQVEVLDQGDVGQVAEGDVLQAQLPPGLGQRQRGGRIRLLLGLVEQFEHPLRRGHCRLQDVGHARHLGDGLGELTRVLDEGLHVAQGEAAGGHLQAAEDADGDVVEVADEEHGGHDDARDELGLEAGLVELLVLVVEGGDGLRLPSEHLHDVVTGVHLLHVAVQASGALPLQRELLLRALGDDHGHHHRQAAR